MDFSEQLIAVFDALAEKFGVVIDWGSANVVPYITDLANRIVQYEIATSIIWCVLSVCAAVSLLLLFRFCRNCKEKENKRGSFYLADNWACAAFACAGFAVLCAIPLITQVFDIVKAISIPEATIIGFVKGLGGGG